MNTKKLFISAAVAGLLAASLSGEAKASGNSAKKADAKFKCEGGNACKGKGACHTAANKCAGKNACTGKAWIYLKDSAACDKAKAEVAKLMKDKPQKKTPAKPGAKKKKES